MPAAAAAALAWAVGPGLVVTAAAVGGGLVYASTKEQTKSAEKEAKKQRAFIAGRELRQLEAGEYFEELSREQMELQSQMGQIKLLSDVITSQRQAEPRILQLPAAKTYTPVERINSAIDDFLRTR